MNWDRQLQELLDREAIRQLVNRYFHYARTKNPQGIINMFAPDAVFDVPVNMVPRGVHAGRAAIEDLYRLLRKGLGLGSLLEAFPVATLLKREGRAIDSRFIEVPADQHHANG